MKYYIVDCFAEDKYQGNQLLVVMPDRTVSDEEMAQIAREINFSETSFILSGKKADGSYDVRIWTPNVGEVPFAGHPTLGTAHVIHHCLENREKEDVILDLPVGQIPVKAVNEELVMRQNSPVFGNEVSRDEIAGVFGIQADDISEDYPVQWVSTGLPAVIVPLKSRKVLSSLKMNREYFEKYVSEHPDNYCNHLFFVDMGKAVLEARCLMEDFVEDPATGSANGNLAGYLLKHEFFGRKDIAYTVIQGEDMGRKSVLKVHGSYINDEWIIEVGGRCHIVAEGDWK